MPKRFDEQINYRSELLVLILLLFIGTALVDITIGKPYFNITQSINLSQVIGRSDLNSSALTNSTANLQAAQLANGTSGDSTIYPGHPAHVIDGTVPNTTLQQPNWMGSESGLASSVSQVSPSTGSQSWANEIMKELGLVTEGPQSSESQDTQSQGSQSSKLPAFLQ